MSKRKYSNIIKKVELLKNDVKGKDVSKSLGSGQSSISYNKELENNFKTP